MSSDSQPPSKIVEIFPWLWMIALAVVGGYFGFSHGLAQAGVWQAIGFGIVGLAAGALISSLTSVVLQFVRFVN